MRASVAVIAYNQERFVEQAILSALQQKTEFDYEIIVGDDASTDRTRSIAQEIERAYPERVRVLARETNAGPATNFLETFTSCRGDYVALLDGDDFWCSPHKLQRQVDFLDAHPGCSMCYHATKTLEDDGTETLKIPPDRKAISDLADLISTRFHYISSCSLMLRNGLFDPNPDWWKSFTKVVPGDWALQLLHARQGNIGYIDEVMGVYRLHTAGIWSRIGRITQLQVTIDFFKQIDVELDHEYSDLIRKHVRKMKMRLFIHRHMPFIVPFGRLITRHGIHSGG